MYIFVADDFKINCIIKLKRAGGSKSTCYKSIWANSNVYAACTGTVHVKFSYTDILKRIFFLNILINSRYW